MVQAKRKVNFTEGPLFWPMFKYALPIIATALLSVLYNTADKVIVGQFSGDDNAIGAIASTSFVFNLYANFLIGVGSGVGVLTAQLFGAKKHNELGRAVNNAMLLASSMAAVMFVIANLTCEPILQLLGTKEAYYDGGVLYLRIIFVGLFASSIYQVGAGVLRSVGDSKSPLYIAMISGLINVILNIFFVSVCDMSVDGVAIATVISQYYSAVSVVIILIKRKTEPYHLTFKGFAIDKELLGRMLYLGIPQGFQSALFSLTNLVTASAVNTFPDAYVTARGIGLDIDHMINPVITGFYTATMTATGQNYGKGDFKRVRKVFIYGMILSLTSVLIVSMTMLVFREQIAMLFVSSEHEQFEEIVKLASEWSMVMLSLYFTNGLLHGVSGAVKGMGYSLSSLVANIIGTCVVRLLWVFFVFPYPPFNTFTGLALMYPVSWGALAIALGVVCIFAFNKMHREEKAKAAMTAEENLISTK